MWNPFKMNDDQQQTSNSGNQGPIQPNPPLTGRSNSGQNLNRDIGPPPRMGDGTTAGGGSGGFTGGQPDPGASVWPPPNSGRQDDVTIQGGAGGTVGNNTQNLNSGVKPPIPGGDDNLRTGGGLPLPGKSGGDAGASVYPGPGDGTWSGGKPPGDVWIQGNNGTPGGGTSTTPSNSGQTTTSGAEIRNQNTLDNQGLNRDIGPPPRVGDGNLTSGGTGTSTGGMTGGFNGGNSVNDGDTFGGLHPPDDDENPTRSIG